MSFIHPYLNLEDVLESMRWKELMGKNPFWYFEFDPIATLKPQFHCWPKSLNFNNSVFVQPILNPRIELEISSPWESMVKTPFWVFASLPFENKGDSSSYMMDRSRTIEVRLIWNFQMLDLENSTQGLE